MAGIMLPQTWSDPVNVAQDVRSFGDVEIQVVGTPSAPYTPLRSLDGTNYVAANAYDKDGAPVTSISSAGIYTLLGGAKIKMGAGSGSVITIRARE